jgi:hypothetical protein
MCRDMAFGLFMLVLVLTAFAVLLGYTIRTGISPVPTTPRVAAEIFAASRAERLPLDAGGTVYELGSGWGHLALALAGRFPDRAVVGYELSPLPWLVSRLWARLRPRANLALRRADFMAADLSDAALVVCYLYPGAMRRLRGKLERELPAGAMVISNAFLVPGWQPAEVRHAADQYRTPVYRYRMPPPLEPPPEGGDDTYGVSSVARSRLRRAAVPAGGAVRERATGSWARTQSWKPFTTTSLSDSRPTS